MFYRKAVLFLPPYAGRILGPPLGLLSLAGSLREAGYEPRIIDGALLPDYESRIAREIPDAICFGVSLLTGPMILDAIRVSRMVKRLRPEMPVIFGGWHPSLLTAETLREDFVDVVVRHQGDITLVEALRRIEHGKPLDLVAGCWFKRGGRICENPDRPAAPVSCLPAPAFDLIDFDAYERATGDRKLPYATSIGCPYACNYCTDMVFYNRRFNAYSPEHVVNDLAGLAAKYRVTEVCLLDSNFLVDVRRALAIARGIMDSGARFRWTFQGSTDLLCRMSDDDVKLLAASGVSHIGFGTESASPHVLELMNKRHQTLADIYGAAAKTAQAGIPVTFNLIFGYPGEDERHRAETLRVMAEIGRRFPNVSFSPNLFTPYPGIPIWPELRRRGMREPDTLAGWSNVDLSSNHLPWLRGRAFESLNRGIRYLLLLNSINAIRRGIRSRTLEAAVSLAGMPLNWRVKHAFFKWPVELWLSAAKRRFVVRRSLLTGQPLARELANPETCQ